MESAVRITLAFAAGFTPPSAAFPNPNALRPRQGNPAVRAGGGGKVISRPYRPRHAEEADRRWSLLFVLLGELIETLAEMSGTSRPRSCPSQAHAVQDKGAIFLGFL